jgi:hypothetical protein
MWIRVCVTKTSPVLFDTIANDRQAAVDIQVAIPVQGVRLEGVKPRCQAAQGGGLRNQEGRAY